MEKIRIKAEERIEKLKVKINAEQRKIILKKNKEEARSLVELGKLLKKTGLTEIDKLTLLGALNEIKEMSVDKANLVRWKESGAKNERSSKQNDLIVSFKESPTEEVKNKLKSFKFSWNKFRNEWYGKGIEKDLKNEFKNSGILVETLS
jgi:hypothetical protein